MPLRLLRLLYAIWFVGIIWLNYFSIVRYLYDRVAAGLVKRFILTLFWPLALLTKPGRAALLPKQKY
jgi:hypothetical protein